MQKKFGLSNLKKQPIKDISTIPCYIIKENLIFDALYFLQGLMANRKDIGIRMAKSELPQNIQSKQFIKQNDTLNKQLNAVSELLDPLKRENTFELFGLDFMKDESSHTWLIETNTNPCLEQTGPLD